MAIGANNLLMLALSNFRRKLFDLQTFQNQAHIISVTGIIIYFLGTYYLYTGIPGVRSMGPSLSHSKSFVKLYTSYRLYTSYTSYTSNTSNTSYTSGQIWN